MNSGWSTVRLFLLLVLFSVLLISPSFGFESSNREISAYQAANAKCQVMEDPGAVSLSDFGDIKLDGTVVDSVNCSKLEAYTYPETEHATPDWSSSLLRLFLTVLAPSILLLMGGGVIARRFSVSIRETAFIFLTSFVAFIGSLLMFGAIDNYLLNYNEIILLIPLLAGLLSPAAYISYRKEGQDTGSKAEPAIAFIFSIMLYWTVIGLLFMSQTSL